MMGEHYLLDLYDCNSDSLNDEEYLKQLLEEAANLAGATLLKTESYKFEPCGVTAFCLLAESHISIHTWPEKGQAAVDVFTCGDCNSEAAGEFIAEGVKGYGRSKQLIVRK